MDRQVRTDSYVGRILKREFVELQLVGWGCVCVYIDGPGTEQRQQRRDTEDDVTRRMDHKRTD